MADAVRLALERVLHAPLADAEHDTQELLLAREAALLDILAHGEAVRQEKKTPVEDARAERLRLWAERGDFSQVRASDLDQDKEEEADALSKLRALRAPPPEAPPAPPPKAGTIGEGEFFPLRDGLLQQLESALFNAEQAQNLLGMLIHNARAQAAPNAEQGTVLAAQPEYFLEPAVMSLSALQLHNDEADLEGRTAPVAERKLVLEEKQQSLRRAASLLAQGAAELRESHASERARWSALSDIQKKGWKLTPGRPLVDIERFDVGQRRNVLAGFGTPLLQGSGALNEEGARDAWIGYGPAEAPVPLLQRTLAYWADAGEDEKAKLAFPDRAWRQLRVSFCVEGGATWVSAGQNLSANASLDAQLCDAQLDAVDTQLFDEVAAHSGTLSPVLARTVNEECITLPLSSTLSVQIALVPHDDQVVASEAVHISPLASLLLAVLRLRMLRSWSQRVDALRSARVTQKSAPPRADLVAPLWELYQYTLVRCPTYPVPLSAPCRARPCRACGARCALRVAALRDACGCAPVACVAARPVTAPRDRSAVRRLGARVFRVYVRPPFPNAALSPS